MSVAPPKARKASKVSLRQHLDVLRRSVRSLPPGGEDGFEGLLAVAFGAITRMPFRIADSGAQFGRDGAAIGADSIVAFEAKRYDGKIPPDTIKAKLFDLSVGDRDVDLWILGATVGVGDQIATAVEKYSSETGVATLILDWPGTGLGCWRSPKIDHLCSLKIDQGRKPSAVALGVF